MSIAGFRPGHFYDFIVVLFCGNERVLLRGSGRGSCCSNFSHRPKTGSSFDTLDGKTVSRLAVRGFEWENMGFYVHKTQCVRLNVVGNVKVNDLTC